MLFENKTGNNQLLTLYHKPLDNPIKTSAFIRFPFNSFCSEDLKVLDSLWGEITK